jgi:hypothetical protein
MWSTCCDHEKEKEGDTEAILLDGSGSDQYTVGLHV